MKKKYVIFPRIQFKYAGLLALLTLVYGIVLVFVISSLLVREIPGELAAFDLLILNKEAIYVGIALVVAGSVLTFVSTILILHRFLGPIVAINRSLANYKENGKFEGIQIRKEDEMKVLTENLNEVLKTHLK